MKTCGKVILSILTLSLAACGGDGSNDSGAATLGGTTTGANDASTGEPEPEPEDDGNDESTGPAETDGGTGTTTGDEPADSAETGSQCEQEMFSFDVEPQTPNVMLVLDKSRSMSNIWDHDLDPNTAEITRWNSLVNVVDYLTHEFGAQINFGAQLFPSADAYLDEPVNEFSCRVLEAPEVPVGPATAAEIIASIPEAADWTISGGTPAYAGVESALAHLDAVAPDAPRAIVLVTDGAPNCNPAEAPEDTLFVYDQEVTQIINESFTGHQTPVYVVGINILDYMETKPAVNPAQAINDMAVAGGVPAPGPDPYYNSFNEPELASALEEVVGAIECTITLEEQPIYPENVSVEVGNTWYPQVADCATEDGWVYTSPAGPYNAIQLCGAACDDLQGGNTVGVDYLCPG